jgi:hypothetical protein
MKWISIENEPPETGTYAVTNGEHICLINYRKSTEYGRSLGLESYWDDEPFKGKKGITHYIKIPKSPINTH